MPFVTADDLTMYYESYGEGDPLLLIGGLANDVTDYTAHTKIITELSRSFRVIIFDNRGVGRTDKPDAPYSIETMAGDTAGLLSALGVRRAHVIGVSLGGRIALEVTLAHPDLVDALVLVSTGPRVVKTWRRSLVFNVLRRLPVPGKRATQPEYAFRRQAHASSSYDCTDRLHEISVPTLVLHGANDGMAPFKLARDMHEKIPGSRMVTAKAGHLLVFSHQQQFITATLDFLRAVPSPTA